MSDTGTLVFRNGSGASQNQMVWLDRAGKVLETVGQPGGYISPSLSPDGRRLAVHRHDLDGGDIWLVDGATISRFTFDAAQDNSTPIWSPDGRMIAFGSFRNGKWGIYQKPSNGSGDEQLLIELGALSAVFNWSPDGSYLVYYINDPKTGNDLFGVPLMGDRKPFPIAQTVFNEGHAQISPDGKWVAYNSNETGITQIYVKPFPSGSGKWQASTGGGTYPRWRRDGRELFFMETSDGGRMMSVDVKTAGESIEFTSPNPLFDSGYINLAHATNFLAYDVSADGQRFLIPRPAASATGDSTGDIPITVVLNWQAALKR